MDAELLSFNPTHDGVQLLISLGTWPEGIWREQPSRDHQRDFRGRMIKVSILGCLRVHEMPKLLHKRSCEVLSDTKQ